MSDLRHVYPVTDDDEHICHGLVCWCVPRYFVPCDECEVEIAPLGAVTERIYQRGNGCWRCVDGLIELTAAEAEACEHPLIIVHNR